MLSLAVNPNKYRVIAITRDEATIWSDINPDGVGSMRQLGEHETLLPERVKPPVEVDHRHRRTGQFHHGHDTDHRFPEYFEAIADRIRSVEGVLIIGHGKGKASYAKAFTDYLENKEQLLAAKIMDVIAFDLVSESEASVKAHARQWFEKNFRKLSTWHEREADRRFS